MSHEEKSTGGNNQYYQVFDGAFRTRVPESHPDAVARINKNSVQVFEKEVRALFGIIENVWFEDSDYGKQVKIQLDPNEDGKNPILSFGVESKDGRDVLRKLPAIDFTKEVRIMPYRFTPENGSQEVSGISFTQKGEDGKYTVKVENHFFDQETKQYKHNFPTIDWDSASESEQKIYKIQRDDFLVNYTKEHVLPRFSEKMQTQEQSSSVEYPEDEINPEDIPF